MPGSDALRDAVARGLELAGAMGGLAGKVAEGIELLPQELRPRSSSSPPEQMSERRVRRVLEQEWDEEVDEVLAELEATPRARATTGQVHRGVRARDGVAVAVKVQRPGVEEAIRADLGTVTALARLAAAVSARLDAAGLAARARAELLDELDHELEAQRQRAFARAYRGHPFVVVPAVDTRLSTRRVLVSEWVEGMNASEVARLDQSERDRAAEALLRFFGGSPYRAGLVHADPHPANWLLREDGRVAVVDYGAAGPVDRGRIALNARVFAAGAARDAEAAREALVELGYLPDRSAVDFEAALAAALATAGWAVDAGRSVRVDDDLIRGALRAIECDLAPFIDAFVLPPADLLQRRAEATLPAALAPLKAELPWGAIAAEWCANGPPAGALGEADQAFWSGPSR